MQANGLSCGELGNSPLRRGKYGSSEAPSRMSARAGSLSSECEYTKEREHDTMSGISEQKLCVKSIVVVGDRSQEKRLSVPGDTALHAQRNDSVS